MKETDTALHNPAGTTEENGICSTFTAGSMGAPSPSANANKSGGTVQSTADEGTIQCKFFETIENVPNGAPVVETPFRDAYNRPDFTVITGIQNASVNQGGSGGLESPFQDMLKK